MAFNLARLCQLSNGKPRFPQGSLREPAASYGRGRSLDGSRGASFGNWASGPDGPLEELKIRFKGLIGS